ncbi:MAG: glycosyltransferase family 4 protein [Bacteriovoracaceae bacterium]|nr:glycosyltransferase family 4 protein [Bacteriovoracaceae bacterium]
MLIIEQMKAGHDVELIVYDHEQSWVSFFREQGIKVNTGFTKKNGFSFQLVRQLQDVTRTADIIHTHDLNPLIYIALSKILAKLCFRKHPVVIHTAHGMDHIIRRPLNKWYERLTGLLTNEIVGVSEKVCQTYKNELWVSSKKITQIDNGTSIPVLGTDTRSPDPQWLNKEFSTDPNKKTFVCVARVLPLKNQMLLLELAKRRNDLNVLIVGPSGDDNYWKKITSEKPSNLIMTGARSDISQILQSSDFFISASLHEGIPVAVLEAGSFGLPCFLSLIPGHLAIQEKSKSPVALFFKPDSIEDLLAQIINYEQNPLEINTNLKKTIYDHFSSHKMSQEYLRVYETHYA